MVKPCQTHHHFLSCWHYFNKRTPQTFQRYSPFQYTKRRVQGAILCQVRGQWLSQATKFEYRVSDIHFDRPWLSCLDGRGKGKYQQPQQERIKASNTKAQAAQHERPWITPGDSVTLSYSLNFNCVFCDFIRRFKFQMGKVLVTRKLHQATRRSPARGRSERLGTRLMAYNKSVVPRPTLWTTRKIRREKPSQR